MQESKGIPPVGAIPNFRLRRPAPIVETGFTSALELEIERTKRKLDAGKFVIEARMDLWDVREAWHYFDEAHDRWAIRKAKIMAERQRQAESNEIPMLGRCY